MLRDRLAVDPASISGFGSQFSGLGSRVSCFGVRVSGFGVRVRDRLAVGPAFIPKTESQHSFTIHLLIQITDCSGFGFRVSCAARSPVRRPCFRGSSRFESSILSHHLRFICECNFSLRVSVDPAFIPETLFQNSFEGPSYKRDGSRVRRPCVHPRNSLSASICCQRTLVPNCAGLRVEG